MAKVFTIKFRFQNATYAALVNLRQVGHDLRCFVHFIDNELHAVLPGRGLVFSLSEGLMRPRQLPDDTAARLVSATAEAITNHFGEEQNY